MQKQKENARLAMQVSRNTIVGNVLLAAIKLLAGIWGKSSAMLSDAIHTLSDVGSTVIVMVGIRISNKDSDAEHQYGHERLECVAAILLAVLLGITGIGIGYGGIQKLLPGNRTSLPVPGVIALIAALLSILAKEGMYWYTKNAAKKVDSSALMADAWHHRSDALSSIGSLLGIGAARMGFPIMDPIASLIICLLIVKAAYDIFRDAVSKLTDVACDDETVAAIEALALSQEGVLGVDSTLTRVFGNRIYVDIEICADGTLSLFEAHNIAERVHDTIESALPSIKHCMVHVNPIKKSSL
ncbi:cation diffusion facilitator family transporter [Eubacteriales bacterium OttesenSCG-928-M02]|nr:cation diffusion facilitator family transporter [Eubacteriales bacterium OttesenSCG-928-M02]